MEEVGPIRILIADDSPDARRLLQRILERQGHEVVPTADGREALEAMSRDDAPPLAILDWVMPEMDGVELCRRLRERETDVSPYLIILTSKSRIDDLVEALGAGADDFLRKPPEGPELEARIQVGARLLAMQDRLATRVRELRDALDRIRTLEGILPICSFCKKVRDDDGYWNEVEAYVQTRSLAEFSHSLCPECIREQYPEVAEEEDGEKDS